MCKLLISLLLALLLPLGTAARAEVPEAYDYGRQALEEAVPPEAADLLEAKNITPDNGGAASLTFSGVIEYLISLIKQQM